MRIFVENYKFLKYVVGFYFLTALRFYIWLNQSEYNRLCVCYTEYGGGKKAKGKTDREKDNRKYLPFFRECDILDYAKLIL